MAGRQGGTLAMLVAGAALIAAACWVGSTRAGEAPRGGTLRIAAANVDFVDPALGYLRDAWLIQDATCARLFRYEKAEDDVWRVVPEVVDRFRVSPDRRIYSFVLKDGFRFHTGVRVTAQSFADAFNRLATLRKPLSPARIYIREIVGADAVVERTSEAIAGIRVLARQRLEIRLTKPAGDLTARLTTPFFCPVAAGTPANAPIEAPAGSGPYYVAEHVVNQRITLRRNPFYRGDRAARVDQIVWTTGEGVAACALAVEEDRVDLCGQPGAPRHAWRELAEKYGINRPGGQLFVSPVLGTSALVFNHDRPAFRGAAQIPLKKAINFAIDRRALVRPFGYLGGKRTDQMLPPALARRESIYPLGGPDVVAARRWHAKAGFKPTKLVFYAQPDPPVVEFAGLLAFNLAKLGIELEVKYFSGGYLGEKVETPDEPFDLVILAWSVDYGDATTYFAPLFGPGAIPVGLNLDDPRLNRRIDAVNRLSGDERRRGWADLDVDLMRNDPPWAPLMHFQWRTLVSPSVGCFVHHPLLAFHITALCKKR